MYFKDMKRIATLCGVPDQECDDPTHCAKALVRLCTTRQMSAKEFRAWADITENEYRAIVEAADGETVHMPRLRELVTA